MAAATTTTIQTLDDLDAIRLHVGLARPQWWALLDVRSEQELIDRYDGYIREDIIARASRIRALYDAFIREREVALEQELAVAEFRLGDDLYLSMSQTARVLGVSDFLISNMRRRGKISSHDIGGRRTAFSPQDIRELLYAPPRGYQSPLAAPFLRYVRAHGGVSGEGT